MKSFPQDPCFQRYEPENIRPGGWIREFLQRDASGITGNLDHLCQEAASGIFFDKKVNKETNGSWSSWWNGETEGNWAEGLVELSFLLADPTLRMKAEHYLNRLVESQDSDGYMGIYRSSHRFSFGDKRCGEFWTQSRIMLILLAGFRATHNERYLDSLNRLATRIIESYGKGGQTDSYYMIPDEDSSKAHGLMIIEPMLALRQLSNRKDVVPFSERLYQDFSEYGSEFPCNDCRLPNLLDTSIPLIGHGPHTCEHLRIPLLLYQHTGKEAYLRAFQQGMEKLIQNMSLSGSCKSDEFIGALRLDIPLQERTLNSLTDSVPLPTTGFEYCSTTELSLTLLSALVVTGDLKYADMQEWLLFNAAIAAKQKDGKAIQYLSADNLYAATKAMGERWDYSPTHTDAAVCCAPNSGRIMPAHVQHMWLADNQDGAIVAALYGSGELQTDIDGSRLKIIADTNYPFDKTVHYKFILDKPARFPFKIRIPRWAEEAQLTLNRELYPHQTISQGEGSLVAIDRTWQDGDELILSMEWKPKINIAVDGSAAVTFGPLLFSLCIPAEAEHSRTYPVEGFYDTNYSPKTGSTWNYTLQLKPDGQPGEFITRVEQEIQQGSYVWEEPPVILRAVMLNVHSQPETVDLVPIGSTILRRTTFPWVKRGKR